MGLFLKKIKMILRDKNCMPTKAHDDDAGYDLKSMNRYVIKPNTQQLVDVGINIKLPSSWFYIWEAQIRPRSGLALKKEITITNSPGTIDCFSVDMNISFLNGEKKINRSYVDEPILSFNELNGSIESDTLSCIIDKGIREVLVFRTDEGDLEVTPNTLVYTKTGIKYAKDITIDDELIKN